MIHRCFKCFEHFLHVLLIQSHGSLCTFTAVPMLLQCLLLSPGLWASQKEPGSCPLCTCALWGPSSRALLRSRTEVLEAILHLLHGISSYVCFCLCTNGVSLIICEMTPSYWRDSQKLKEGYCPQWKEGHFCNH